MYFVARVKRYGDELKIEFKREDPGNEDVFTEDMSNVYVKQYETEDKAKRDVKNSDECVVKI